MYKERSHSTNQIIKRGKIAFVLVTLFVICNPAFPSTEQTIEINPEDSIVLVISNPPAGKRVGNGFAIGDGTLVVTAYHLAFEVSEQGEHQIAGMVRVFSPYLGDECDAEIIAADKRLDMVILKTLWHGHPALRLADDNRIISAERIETIGMPEVIHNFGSDVNEPLQEILTFQRENLPVDFVAIRQQIPMFISLSGIGKLGAGWSGSPMLLEGTSNAAGCFVRLHGQKGQKPMAGEGPAISQVKRLLEQDGRSQSLLPAEKMLPGSKDATDVFLLTLQAYRYYMQYEYYPAFEKAERLIDMRPESSFAYGLAASALKELNRTELAEQYYQKAIKLNPEATTTKIYYAQFLSKQQPDKAMEIFEQIWQLGKYKSYSAILMNNIFTERGEYSRCSELLNETIKVDPNNAYLWVCLGACQFNMGNSDDAIASISKGVELWPEKGPFRGKLAHLMEQNGQLDDAEKHFRKLLEIEPDNPVVHFWLAQFLVKHRPTSHQEALKEAQIALDLPDRGRIPRQPIEELISELQPQTDQESSK